MPTQQPKITIGLLNHVISWGLFLSSRTDRTWTKADAIAYLTLQELSKDISHEIYEKRKASLPRIYKLPVRVVKI